jgi:hypothetical protein
MNQLIQSENVTFDRNEIKLIFEKTDADQSCDVLQLIFYPYYYFEYTLERKSLFYPNGGVIGCTVDGVHGAGAIVNASPFLGKQEMNCTNIVPQKMKLVEAKTIAEKYVYNTISYKMKVFSAPPIRLNRQELFYRPYWIVEGGNSNALNRFLLTVDAVTGKYHPL